MKTEFIEHLQALTKRGISLSVSWDAGGDETLLTFYENGNRIEESYEGIYGKLRDFLIQKFDLPNAGEYYNEGEGVFRLEEERVTFVFSELAYSMYEEDGFETISIEDDLSMPSPASTESFLSALAEKEVYFYGSIFIFRKKITSETFGAMTANQSRVTPNQYSEEVQTALSRMAQSRLQQPFQHGEITYSGKLNAKEATFEQLSLLKYATRKDQREKKITLFSLA